MTLECMTKWPVLYCVQCFSTHADHKIRTCLALTRFTNHLIECKRSNKIPYKMKNVTRAHKLFSSRFYYQQLLFHISQGLNLRTQA
jgi:hypothetical protein